MTSRCQEVLAALECLVDLGTVADAEDRDIFPFNPGHDAESFHGAHCGSDLAGSPQILSVELL